MVGIREGLLLREVMPSKSSDTRQARGRGASGDARRSGTEAGHGSLTERAYTLLEEMIVRLELAPGSAVSEAMLAARLGIGRTPIREALQRLAREHLVVILPRRGIVVSDINANTQLRLLELRREVERLMVRTAARRATAEERGTFEELAAGFECAARDGDDVAFMRVDRAFNELCVACARNEFTAAAMATMQPLARRFWYSQYRRGGTMPEAARLHADVARAIAEGDEAGAARASDLLLDHIERFTRATVGPEP
jgi:DNA-binding GntR family transcriptional regulator